jgi:nitrate/nitrite transporter NarK
MRNLLTRRSCLLFTALLASAAGASHASLIAEFQRANDLEKQGLLNGLATGRLNNPAGRTC